MAPDRTRSNPGLTGGSADTDLAISCAIYAELATLLAHAILRRRASESSPDSSATCRDAAAPTRLTVPTGPVPYEPAGERSIDA
ncbi:MAG TPA: hypothetical protein VF695_00975 [Sphingomonas sp.]|jgi:hypothetical protein